ncbi:MAG: hypothetical protein AB8B69_17640 [Chitinophagales bacterium]
MTIEQFWELCRQKNGIEVYDDLITLINGEEISKSILDEEYDLVSLVLEIKGALQKVKDYDTVQELYVLLEEKQKPLFKQLNPYFMDDAIIYHCFKRNEEVLLSYVDRYIADPLDDIDLLFKSHRFLIFYGQSHLVEKLTRSIYKTVNESPDVWGDGSELSTSLFRIELQKYYEKYLQTGELDLSPLKEAMVDFGFDSEDDNEMLNTFEQALQYDYRANMGELVSDFKSDRGDFIDSAYCYFHKYMYDKGIPFLVSGEIWDTMLKYWAQENEKQYNNPNRFFAIDHKKFDRYLSNQGGMIMDYRINIFAGLWGSGHIFEFLFSLQLIDNRTYDSFKGFYNRFTNVLIEGYLAPDLWQFSFVLDWGQVSGVKDYAWAKQMDLFSESFDLKKEVSPNPLLRPAEPERYEEAEIEEEESEQESVKILDESPSPPKITKPKIILPRKFSRNEKVKVRYKDGSEKETKFKRVEKDLYSGECELV